MQHPLFVCQAQAMCIYSEIFCVGVFIISISYLKMVNKAAELINISYENFNTSSILMAYPIFHTKRLGVVCLIGMFA